LGAELRWLEGAALQVAGIDGPGLSLEEDLSGVDMAERPVVHAGGSEVLQVAGRVVVVAGLPADVRMEETYVKSRLGAAGKGLGEVFPFCPPAEAAPVNDRERLPLPLDRPPLDLPGAEDVDARGPAPDGRPALLHGVVVSVNDEGGNSRPRE